MAAEAAPAPKRPRVDVDGAPDPEQEELMDIAALVVTQDVRGLLLLEERLHAVLARTDAACDTVATFLALPASCARLLRELLAEPPADAGAEAAAAQRRVAFAASCVLGGGVPEVAATLATSAEVWKALIAELRRPALSVSAQSMLVRMFSSFALRASSKAREGLVVMAKRHSLPALLLHRAAEAPSLLPLLALLYRHDHAPKRYAFWSSLELCATLGYHTLDAAAAPLLRELACEALISLCEWSAGGVDGSAAAAAAGGSINARQWGLSVLAVPPPPHAPVLCADSPSDQTVRLRAGAVGAGGECRRPERPNGRGGGWHGAGGHAAPRARGV